MKKTVINMLASWKWVLWLVLFVFYSCERTELPDLGQEQEYSTRDILDSGTVYSTDWSGKIHVMTTWKEKWGSQVAFDVSLPVDYVLVGGGAYARSWNGSSGFLTESYPSESLTAWLGASRSHGDSDPHYLRVYAIGMRMEGVSADYLRSKMQIFTLESDSSSHPNTYKTVSLNYLLIGGGAKVNLTTGQGNLLVHSYPDGNTWYAKSKDHLTSSPCTITAYAIGIENISFPNVGLIETAQSSQMTYQSSGLTSTTVVIPSGGWTITCPGGKTTFNGIGRLMTGIIPNPSGLAAITYSKDHGYADSGYNYAYAVRIRKKM